MDIDYKQIENGSLMIEIILSPSEVDYLKNDLNGAEGIVDWFSKGPSAMKILKCKERMENEMIPKLRKMGIAIPSDDNELLDMMKKHPDYKNRQFREMKGVIENE